VLDETDTQVRRECFCAGLRAEQGGGAGGGEWCERRGCGRGRANGSELVSGLGVCHDSDMQVMMHACVSAGQSISGLCVYYLRACDWKLDCIASYILIFVDFTTRLSVVRARGKPDPGSIRVIVDRVPWHQLVRPTSIIAGQTGGSTHKTSRKRPPQSRDYPGSHRSWPTRRRRTCSTRTPSCRG